LNLTYKNRGRVSWDFLKHTYLKLGYSMGVSVLMLFACRASEPLAPAKPPVEPTRKLEPASCHKPEAGETGRLSKSWAGFLPYVRACNVKNDRAETVITVLTIFATEYYDKLPSRAETVEMPKPILFNTSGNEVGNLPYNFPDDPPFGLWT